MRCRLLLYLVLPLFTGLLVSGCGDPPAPPSNTPPSLTGITAQPSSTTSGDTVTISLEASDPDGDTLTYSWAQEPASPAGTFSSTSAPNPTWTAPQVAANTTFRLTLTVSDGKASPVTGSVTITVLPPAPANRPPTLTQGPQASATTVDEQQAISLSVTASDPDNDTLTYSWTQEPASPAGTFNSSSIANPSWTTPDVSANGTYTLRVTVTDGRGGSAQGTVSINVRKVNRAPTVAASITGPTTLLAGDTGTFSITASDPDGDPLTYSWEQPAPELKPGNWVGSRTGSSAQWYSLPIDQETSFTFSVSVTDGESAPLVRTLTIPVTVPRYSDVQNIWNTVPSCTSCHGTQGQLNLGPTVSHGNLVGVAAVACAPLQRVTPFDPDKSVLVRKLEGTTCGNRMPRNNAAYFDTNPGLAVRVRSWIMAGAENN
jgi:hypothetical protein